MTTTTYSLTNIKQLIDLNKDKVNFELDFHVQSITNDPFDALVVTQEMLDSETPLEYQKANGVISGKIVSDQNVYSNYFLLLKADNPTDCVVTINIHDIQPASASNNNENNYEPLSSSLTHSPHPRKPILKQSKSKFKLNLKNILLYVGIALIAGVAIFLVVKAFLKSKEEPKVENVVPQITQPPPPAPTPIIEFPVDKLRSELSNEISQKFDGLSTSLTEKLSSVTDKLNDGLGGLGEKIENGFSERLTDGLSNKLTNGLSERLSERITDGVANKLSSGLNDTLSKIGSGLGEQVQSNLSKISEGLGERVQSNLSKISNGLGEQVQDNLSKIGDGLGEKFESNLSKISDGLGEAVQSNLNKIGDGLQEKMTLKLSEDGSIKDTLNSIKTQLETRSEPVSKSISVPNIGNSESVIEKLKSFKIPTTSSTKKA